MSEVIMARHRFAAVEAAPARLLKRGKSAGPMFWAVSLVAAPLMAGAKFDANIDELMAAAP